jgi:nascent polypeptide-associated complex subunit alpha
MLPGMNSRQMQKMMKQMGIQQVEIPAVEVIIRTNDKEIVISNPSVSKVNMMGQQTYQVVGESVERAISTTPEISSEDIETVMGQANVSEEIAKNAIESANGDLAQAIIDLTQE